MARKHQGDARDKDPLVPVADEPAIDATFEEAQRLLQAVIAEVRQPGSIPGSSLPSGLDEAGEHRRWRRRVHGDTSAHAVAATIGEADAAVDATEERVSDPDMAVGQNGDVDDIESAEGAATEATLAGVDEQAPTGASGEPGIAGTLDSDVGATFARRRRRKATPDGTSDDIGESATLSGGVGTTHATRPTRRRGPGQPGTIGAPTAEYVLDVGEPTAVGTEVESTDEPAPTPQRGRRVLVACVAAVVAIGVVAFVVASSGSDDEVATPTANVQPRLEFPPVTTPEGATVTRAWELTGAKGAQLDGTLTVENPTSKSVTTTFTEVIPKSLASSVDQITFDPQPVVVKADPMVQYTATVAPGATFVATYTIEVEPLGRTRQRLLTWADDLAKETGTTTTTTVPPTTTTAPPSTTPSTTPAVTTPTTTGPPATTTPPPPADGSIWIAISNTDPNAPDTTFTFSDGTSVVAPHGGLQGSSPYVTVSPGVHSITLLNGTATSITCSGRSSGSGNTATYDVAPGEQYVGCTWTASSP